MQMLVPLQGKRIDANMADLVYPDLSYKIVGIYCWYIFNCDCDFKVKN